MFFVFKFHYSLCAHFSLHILCGLCQNSLIDLELNPFLYNDRKTLDGSESLRRKKISSSYSFVWPGNVRQFLLFWLGDLHKRRSGKNTGAFLEGQSRGSFIRYTFEWF